MKRQVYKGKLSEQDKATLAWVIAAFTSTDKIYQDGIDAVRHFIMTVSQSFPDDDRLRQHCYDVDMETYKARHFMDGLATVLLKANDMV